MYSRLIVECDIPTGTRQVSLSLSGNDSQKMKTLCWFFIEMGQIGRFMIPSDLDTYVREKFTAHGKKLPDGKEIMKAFNTARLFEHWKAASSTQNRQQVVMGANTASQQSQTVERGELQMRIKQLLKDTYYPLSHYSKNYFGKIRVDDSVAQIVLNVLDTLEYREVSCLCLKYGITGSKLDFGEIAQYVPQTRNPYVSVSPGRTRQIIAKAIRKLRHPTRMDRIFQAMAKTSPHQV
jgi:DNA-directed RNA polymerase sigma subunit (sigma70/sigma32)